jgi:hypothetical protein
MNAPAITHGSLVDVRNVNQHKCVRLVIDIPAERAREIIDTFGWPTMVDPVPVAIARLAPSVQQREETAASSKTPVPTAQPRQKPPTTPTPAGAPSYAQRLGIACSQPAFWRFLEEEKLQAKPWAKISSADEAADVVRFICEVKSRSETIKGTPAGDAARDLLLDYDNYVRDVA